jgi:hypothetical protein
MKRLFKDNGELGLEPNLHIDANNQIKELFERFTESGYCYKDFKLMLLMLADNCEVEFEHKMNYQNKDNKPLGFGVSHANDKGEDTKVLAKDIAECHIKPSQSWPRK